MKSQQRVGGGRKIPSGRSTAKNRDILQLEGVKWLSWQKDGGGAKKRTEEERRYGGKLQSMVCTMLTDCVSWDFNNYALGVAGGLCFWTSIMDYLQYVFVINWPLGRVLLGQDNPLWGS